MKLINERRSVREYCDYAVEDKKIIKIIKAAMQAPSAKNEQPWEFLVIKDKEKLEKLASCLPNCHMVNQASFIIVFLTRVKELKTECMYPQDMASSVTLAMLEAKSLKVGSCWCGIYPRQERMEKVREIFKITKEELEPFAVVSFGYPKDENSFKFINRYQKERVHFEEI